MSDDNNEFEGGSPYFGGEDGEETTMGGCPCASTGGKTGGGMLKDAMDLMNYNSISTTGRFLSVVTALFIVFLVLLLIAVLLDFNSMKLPMGIIAFVLFAVMMFADSKFGSDIVMSISSKLPF